MHSFIHMGKRAYRLSRPYGVSLFFVFVAVALQWAIDAVTRTNSPYLTIYPAVVVVGLFVGTGPALVGGALGILAVDLIIIAPAGSLEFTPGQVLAMGVVAVIAILAGEHERYQRAGGELRQRWSARESVERVRVEAELQSMALFPEQNPNPVMRLDPDGRILYVNRAARTMLSLTDNQIPRTLLETAQAVLRAGQQREIELPCGVDRVYWLGIVPFPERNYVNIYGRDITVRKRAEEALRRSEDQLRLITDSVPALISYIDAGYTYRLANRTYERWFGHDPEQVRGRHVREVLGEAAWERVRPYMRRALAGEQVRYEEELPYSGGGNRWVHVVYTPDRGPDGRVRGFAVLVHDIGESKQAEDSLRQGLAELQTIYESAPIGLCVLDTGLRFVRVNRRLAEINGVPAADHIGRSVREIVPGLADAVEPMLRRVIETQTPMIEVEVSGTTAAQPGVVRYWVESYYPLVDPDGVVLGLNVVAAEVSDSKRMEQERAELLEAERAARGEIERVNRVKDEFLASVSHELRSPLSSILGWARLVSRGRAPDPAAALGIIERSATILAQLVDDLLDMSRIISGKVRLSMNWVPMDRLVRDVMEGFKIAAQAKHIEMREEIASGLDPIRCDSSRMQQVATNLLSNALKFTPERGRITVRLEQVGDRLKLQVIDTGRGISPEFLPYLFNKFLQADTSTTRRHGGLGLGLALVKYFVEIQGGSVTAASEGEGRGATFTVALPVGAEEGVRDRPILPGNEDEDDTLLPEHLLILLIDDDANAVEMIGRILADTGARVLTAGTAEAGLQMLFEERPDVVVSDVSMPGEDGYSLVQKIRSSQGWFADVACIALTALARPEDRERALGLGFDEHLSKLSDPGQLVRTIRKAWTGSLVRRLERQKHETPPSPYRPSSGAVPHILVAEDNDTLSELLKECLEEDGYRVSVADSVEQGLAIAANAPVDLVLSDLRLRDGTCCDLIVKLREHRDVPGIVISGYSDETFRAESRQAGFDDYLVKPVAPEMLCERVARLLGTTATAER